MSGLRAGLGAFGAGMGAAGVSPLGAGGTSAGPAGYVAGDAAAGTANVYGTIDPQTPPSLARKIIGLPPTPPPSGFWNWPNVQEAYRLAADDYVRSLKPYPGGYRGRGIVVVGGGRYLVSAYITIRVLRHVGCRLPIELWHTRGEVDGGMSRLLSRYQVTCRDADEEVKRLPFRFLHGHWWKGWQLKPYAVFASRFREVLMLDADSYPTRDPEYLFDWPPFKERGAVFWPDLPSSSHLLTPEKWAVFGAEPRYPPFESAQLLIDKRRCWRHLQLALWYNSHADFVYHILWGDKDTFNVAWRKLRHDYAMPRPTSDWDTHTILQYGPEGNVLFQHRCQDKFRLKPVNYESNCQPFLSNRFNPRLAHEETCFQFLDELRRDWPRPDAAGHFRVQV